MTKVEKSFWARSNKIQTAYEKQQKPRGKQKRQLIS